MMRPLRILALLAVAASVALPQSHKYSVTPFAKLRSAPAFQARVDSVICWTIFDPPELRIWVTRSDGVKSVIAWESATTQHWAFARSLQLSNTYRFPEVWDEFIARNEKK